MPHQSKIRRGLQRPDLFTVVAEHFHTDTVEYADIVLPATMQLEQADLQISYGHLYISWNEPANSLFANVADQMKRSGPPVLRIHPADAAARGLETGHEARVFNDRGAFVARVELTDRVRRGVVASTKGRWPRFVKGEATVNATVDERDADMGGGAVFHDNRVEVERL